MKKCCRFSKKGWTNKKWATYVYHIDGAELGMICPDQYPNGLIRSGRSGHDRIEGQFSWLFIPQQYEDFGIQELSEILAYINDLTHKGWGGVCLT